MIDKLAATQHLSFAGFARRFASGDPETIEGVLDRGATTLRPFDPARDLEPLTVRQGNET